MKYFGFFSRANPVLSKIKRKDKEIKNNNNLILRKMFIAGFELTIPDSRCQCSNHWAMKDLEMECVFVLFIDNQFEHGQNCVNATGTPCPSANILNTLVVSAQLSERVSSLTRRSLSVKCVVYFLFSILNFFILNIFMN